MGFVMLRFLFEIWCLLIHNVHCFLSRWPRDAQNLFHFPLFEPNDRNKELFHCTPATTFV